MLNESFVPVAIDINIVKNSKGTEGEFFRHIAEQGHYAGRTKPTPTRQGLYAVGIDGDLLHSLNSTNTDQMISLMNRALAKWDRKKGGNTKPFGDSPRRDDDLATKFPEGGLILRQTMRDLPRTDVYRQTTDKHNFDHVWLTKAERNQFVPRTKNVGDQWQIPASTIARIAQFHTVDQVRGEANCWNRDEVQATAMRAEVVDVDGSIVTVRLAAEVKCRKEGSGETNPFNRKKVQQPISNDLKIRGWLSYDLQTEQFRTFDLLAAGMRSGADVYNFRFDDPGPSPIGFAFELLDNERRNQIRPKFLGWNYFDSE